MSRIYLSLGSNMGDTQGHIEEALGLLSERVSITKTSSYYETEPVGYKDQPWFLNIAAEGETDLNPQELLTFTQGIEHRMKRVKTIVNGPRNIDIDILLYGNEAVTSDNLIIPHPRMTERAFVLVPLYEIAPGLVIFGTSLSDLLDGLRGEEIRKRV